MEDYDINKLRNDNYCDLLDAKIIDKKTKNALIYRQI